jgi:hypothetical protein
MISAIEELRESLHPKIREALDKRGFDEFSEIQMRAVPQLIRGDNAVQPEPAKPKVPFFHSFTGCSPNPTLPALPYSISPPFAPSTAT